jgi:hypothetical protein
MRERVRAKRTLCTLSPTRQLSMHTRADAHQLTYCAWAQNTPHAHALDSGNAAERNTTRRNATQRTHWSACTRRSRPYLAHPVLVLGVPCAPRVASPPVKRCELRTHHQYGELCLVPYADASPHRTHRPVGDHDPRVERASVVARSQHSTLNTQQSALNRQRCTSRTNRGV